MADTKPKKRVLKRSETVRERASKSAAEPKQRRLKRAAQTAGKPIASARRIGKKEYHLPLPDNRLGNILGRRVRLLPRFFGNAWREVRQVEWPRRKETLKLTLAVFMFAIVFGLVITLTDFGLDRLFKKVLLK